MAENGLNMGVIITIFIGVILGVTLINSLGDSVFSANNPLLVTFENISVVGGRINSDGTIAPNITFVIGNDDIISIDGVFWSNGTTMVEGTDYHLNSTVGEGQGAVLFSIINTTTSSTSNAQSLNFTHWNYTHAGDDYIQGSSISRTFIGLILIFFALGIIGIALMGLRRSGILDAFNR